MKHLYIFTFLLAPFISFSQVSLDTLAIQDFENTPATPTWTYTGTLDDLQSGTAPTNSAIPGTPLGIGSSQAWHVETVSGGNQITFDNITVPSGYDSVRVNFHLAATNLSGTGGGPDNLDYVLVEYSLDNGNTWVNRLRIRGAVNNNSYWPYSASGEAKVQYTPTTEEVFQPINSGLQDTEGYSFCEIAFPGSITQVSIRITPRSSSSQDSWLVDNLVITGETPCTASTSSIVEQACDSYTAPSGATYSSSGTITDVIPNAEGCDSTITIDLTVNNSETGTDVVSACEELIWIDGNTYTADNNTATHMLTTSAGCDSLVTLDLTINSNPGNTVTQSGSTLTADENGAQYQWLDCEDSYAVISGATNQAYTPTNTGDYAVEVTMNGCADTSVCNVVEFASIEGESMGQLSIYPNPASDVIEIDFQNTPIEIVSIEIYSTSGKLVRSYSNQLTTLDVSDIQSGVYFIHINSADEVQNRRIKFIKK